MKTGQAFVEDINACRLGAGQIGIWWLGQHSFVVKVGEQILYLDPFLTDLKERTVPPLMKPEELTNAHLVCGSHDHLDHIDRGVWPAIAQASPRAKFVIPKFFQNTLPGDLGIPADRFVAVNDGETIEPAAGVRISAVAAAHEFLDQNPDTGHYPYLGYIIETGGCTIYHAGDTCIYEGMITKLRRWKFDVMFLPINGRDAKRLAMNIVGNMTYQEAVDLAGALEPGVVIPAHYEMFKANLGDVGGFVEYAKTKFPQLRTHVCTHGERFVFQKN